MRSANARAQHRRVALAALVALSAEVGGPSLRLRRPAAADVGALLRRLNRLCTAPLQASRLRDAVKKYKDNGGVVDVDLAPDEGGAGGLAATAAGGVDADVNLPKHSQVLLPNFRIHSTAFMLTYNSKDFTRSTWAPFREFVVAAAASLGAAFWAATLELTPGRAGVGVTERIHAHAYVMWTDGVGYQSRNTDAFVFQGGRPRVDACHGWERQGRFRVAALHGLWYVSVVKEGTLEADSNLRVFHDYEPRASWLRGLWNRHKLSNDRFLELSSMFRTGHLQRKRDVEAVAQDERYAAVKAHVARQRLQQEAAGILRPVRHFPTVEEFVALFDGRVLFRRPLLVIVGGTNLGKSMLAEHVLGRVGASLGVPGFVEVTVEDDHHLDFHDFRVEKHAGVLLDGVADAGILKRHREILQGRAKQSYGARSATMMYAYPFTLAERAVVVTMDLGAANLDMFRTDHWLRDPQNVMLLRLAGEAWRAAPP